MNHVRFDISMSLDGYSAGPDQSLDNPLGVGGEQLHEWAIADAAWRERHGLDGGERSVNTDMVEEMFANVGAVIMGRNMFGGGPGEWDADWKGWWGDDPPFHMPVFVLTHHEREPLPMDGGTTFTFVTDGVDAALARAQDAAGPGKEILISGGAATIQQSLKAGFVDSFQLHVVPVILGAGTRLLDGLDPGTLTLDRVVDGPGVTHLRYAIA
jgi:dihydrofolate reductase